MNTDESGRWTSPVVYIKHETEQSDWLIKYSKEGEWKLINDQEREYWSGIIFALKPATSPKPE